jgi:hypothetical protein
MESLRDGHKPLPLRSDDTVHIRNESDETKKKFIILYHDEYTYNTNDGNGCRRIEEHPALLQGSGIMVSDFIDECDGYLCLTNEQYQ